MLLPFFGHRPCEFDEFRHFKANFFFDNFEQGDIGSPQVSDITDEGTAHGSATRVELADTPRNEVDQNVGIANFLQCLFC